MSTTPQSATRASKKPSTSGTKAAKEVAAVITEWVAGLEGEDAERFQGLHFKYNNTPVPVTAAIMEYFGIDPNTVPTNNAFFTNGYITFRRKVEGDEMTVTGYRDDTPKLNQWPEGLDYELASSALRYDTWGV